MRIMRHLTRRVPVFIAGKLGMHASTVGRVLGRHQTPLLREVDPITGVVIRATRRSTNRYEHDHPGSLIHVDVKKLGRIPDGGGWRVHGRSEKVRGRGSATTTSTPRSMTIPGSRSPRSTLMNAPKRAPGSWNARSRSMPVSGSVSNA